MDLTGKVAVVTGASMGIGEALAKEFATRGASVALSSRDATRAEAARQRVGSAERTLAMACDVRRRSDLEKLLKAALDRFGRLDVWVNNAGHGYYGSVEQMKLEDARELMDTNFFGAIEGMQVAIPVMKRQGSGTVINISSVAGHLAVPYMAIYSASKFALNAIGKAARAELAGSGVAVMTVCPGYIATDFGANAVKGPDAKKIGSGGGITPERVARAVVEGYLKGKREIVVPAKDRLLIKLYQTAPSLLEREMTKRLKPAEQVIAAAQAMRQR